MVGERSVTMTTDTKAQTEYLRRQIAECLSRIDNARDTLQHCNEERGSITATDIRTLAQCVTDLQEHVLELTSHRHAHSERVLRALRKVVTERDNDIITRSPALSAAATIVNELT